MKSQLSLLHEFEDALKDYQISEPSKRILKQTNLVLLVAATSGGRNTIIRELMKTGEYHFIVSDTTREPRINEGVLEKNGELYWFRTEKEVLEDIKKGKYLEAEIIHNQQVSGISIRELEQSWKEQKIAITDVDIGGARNIIRDKPDVSIILVLPPGFEEWQRRLKHRGHMSEEELRRRLQTACTIFTAALEDDHYIFVINDKLHEATAQIHKAARFGEVEPEEQARGRQLAEQLYIATKAYLENT
ncbi:hypothetical protein BH23PAT1_BH23PAT1_3690 [soil metagenome]